METVSYFISLNRFAFELFIRENPKTFFLCVSKKATLDWGLYNLTRLFSMAKYEPLHILANMSLCSISLFFLFLLSRTIYGFYVLRPRLSLNDTLMNLIFRFHNKLLTFFWYMDISLALNINIWNYEIGFLITFFHNIWRYFLLFFWNW